MNDADIAEALSEHCCTFNARGLCFHAIVYFYLCLIIFKISGPFLLCSCLRTYFFSLYLFYLLLKPERGGKV